ncbi:MAG: hypothetical protein WAN69_14400 [Candidatus Korobacteraceae bacterium]
MSYSFACDWQAAIIMDPLKPHQVGYLTEFNGIGLSAPLAKDLQVQCPYSNLTAPAYQGLGINFPVNQGPIVAPTIGSAVAVLQNVSWGGGIADVFSFSCYMSQENALQLETLLQSQPLRTTNLSIGWWITNYDPEPKIWFEEIYPKSPAYPNGKINVVGNNVRLQVSLLPVQVAPHLGYVYSVSFEIVPRPDFPAIIHVASSSTQQVERSWG